MRVPKLFDANATEGYLLDGKYWIDPLLRNAHWIENTVIYGTTSGVTTVTHEYRCSECGGLFGRKSDRYCYNCGARMNGEVIK